MFGISNIFLGNTKERINQDTVTWLLCSFYLGAKDIDEHQIFKIFCFMI